MSSRKYFAAEEPEKLAQYLESKSSQWFTKLINNNYFNKIRSSWDAYYGNYYNSDHSISFSGEQGELANIAINHYRNIGEHTVRMITANRPAFQARSVNTDAKSQIQTTLANGLLEYYMREKKLERYLRVAVESAVILSAGYIKMEWDSTGGEIYDYIDFEPKEGEENKGPIPVYEGDVKFSNLSPFDVVFDNSKESPYDHDWVLCRSFKNKFDLIAQYPEQEKEILGLENKFKEGDNKILFSGVDENYDVPVYEFYHKRTPSVQEGRYMLFLNSTVILNDSPLPYRNIPVYRISPSDVLGTPYGYTIMFDLLPIQEALNSVHSAVLTNISAHAVSNILNPKGNGVTVNQIEGGMNFIEYDKEFGKPETLNLLNTPAEVYNYMEKLEKTMEIISAINSVVRGDPQASLKSGTSLALVQSQALQFISSLQQSYIHLIEDVGTGLLHLLRDFASVPRIAAISGISNRTKMKSFTGDDISSVNRVVVDAGNALASTPAGRSQIAQDLLQMGLIKTPEAYLSVLNTGKLETMVEGQNDELILVKDENERLVSGDEPVSALSYDDHQLHIKTHRCVLSDSTLRHDPELVQRVNQHILEHYNLMLTTDPQLLMIMGQQPPQPMMPPEGMQGQAGPAPSENQNSQMATDLGIPPAGLPELPITATEAMGMPTTAQDLPLAS